MIRNIKITMKIFFLFVTYVCLVSTENICDNWESFKDEKCITILNETKLMSNEEAIDLCSKAANGSTLITIHSREEQEFVVKYLFETRKIVNNIWLGLKNNSNSFEWIDKTSVEFTNWGIGSPLNKSDHKCVEMVSESSPIGKWFDIQCNKLNVAVCQKSPVLSASVLQIKLTEAKNEMKTYQKQIIETLKMNSCNVFGWNQSNVLKDTDGKQRKFIFPLFENKKLVNWDEANNICLKYDASLVEINSQEKQNKFISFLEKLNLNGYPYLWLNAYKDSSGKWKWLRSGNYLTFANWGSGFPISNSGWDYIYLYLMKSANFGKWINKQKQIQIP